ncbi:MAG: hypothetical protein P8O03_03545 [Ilumatobacter sp.]|nr:hypothetical protein [Ilumatobacter sp.]
MTVPRRTVDLDHRTVRNALGGVFHRDDTRQAEFATDDDGVVTRRR